MVSKVFPPDALAEKSSVRAETLIDWSRETVVELSELVKPRTTIVLTQECQRGIIGDLGQGVLPDAARDIGLVDKVGRIVTVGRDAGCPILHCIAEGRPNNPASADNAPILRAGKRGGGTAVWDRRGMEIVDGIDTADTDITSVRTVQASPIIGTEVPTILRNLGIKTVVAVGVSANLGIRTWRWTASTSGSKW